MHFLYCVSAELARLRCLQYAHITEVKPLAFPEVSWLQALQHDEQGEPGASPSCPPPPPPPRAHMNHCAAPLGVTRPQPSKVRNSPVLRSNPCFSGFAQPSSGLQVLHSRSYVTQYLELGS